MPPGLYFRHESSLAHDTGSHPENKARIPAIEGELARTISSLQAVEAGRTRFVPEQKAVDELTSRYAKRSRPRLATESRRKRA